MNRFCRNQYREFDSKIVIKKIWIFEPNIMIEFTSRLQKEVNGAENNIFESKSLKSINVRERNLCLQDFVPNGFDSKICYISTLSLCLKNHVNCWKMLQCQIRKLRTSVSCYKNKSFSYEFLLKFSFYKK